MDDGAPMVTEAMVRAMLPERPKNSHKGMFGRLLLCVGSKRYTGAALLSSAAALRVGAGIVETAVPGSVKPAFSAMPEVCCTAVNNGDAWDSAANQCAIPLLAGKSALGFGCGMDVAEDASLLAAALDAGLPLVIDADGLNLLSRNRTLFARLHDKVVLTPHPGEMSRLLDCPVSSITADPGKVATQAAKEWNCVVLLKGAPSCIASSERLLWNDTGNPGLSKGGSGDVLTGLISGLLCQGLAPFDAACAGAYLLGVSADHALALLGTRMLMARDVIQVVQETCGLLSRPNSSET